MKATFSLSIVLVILGVTSAHDWGWGACPRVSAVENLAVDKFLGEWFVIMQFETMADCLSFNYTRTSESELRVTKSRQYDILDKAGISHKNDYTGKLTIPSLADPGKMRVQWPMNFLGSFDYVVFDTDYVTYAGVYECQAVTSVMHHKSASILAREPDLDGEFISRIIRVLKSEGVDTDEFNLISRKNCIKSSEAGINIRIDENYLSNFFGVATDAVGDAADTIGDIGIKVAAEAAARTAAEAAFGINDDDKESIVPLGDEAK